MAVDMVEEVLIQTCHGWLTLLGPSLLLLLYNIEYETKVCLVDENY